MRIFKSYVNSYWQQVQEWEQDSNAVNKSRPHSQRPQLNWSKEDLWLNLSQRVSYQGFDTFNSGTVGISDSYCWCLVAKSCPTVCDPMDLSMPGFPVLHYLLEFSQTHVHWVSDAIQTSHPLSSPSPLALNLSQHQGLFNDWALRTRWPKYWSFSFNISPSNEQSGLISFRRDLLDLLAVQGTLKSLLQHHSSRHQFFSTQLSL